MKDSGIIKIKSMPKTEIIIKSIMAILLISSFAYSQSKIRYSALGDSYTIGEGVQLRKCPEIVLVHAAAAKSLINAVALFTI